jgi:hypothetical protein
MLSECSSPSTAFGMQFTQHYPQRVSSSHLHVWPDLYPINARICPVPKRALGWPAVDSSSLQMHPATGILPNPCLSLYAYSFRQLQLIGVANDGQGLAAWGDGSAVR